MPIMPGCMRGAPVNDCWPLVAEIMQSDKDVPARFGRSALDLKQSETLATLAARCDEVYTRGALVLLCGPAGTGKSFAAYALACLGYLRHSEGFKGYQAGNLFRMAWQDETKAAYNDAWTRYGTMILDDLGTEAENKTESLDANLYAGLNHRYAGAMPTVITTNYKPDELLGLYPSFTKRLQSRFREWAIIVEVRGKDMRKVESGESQRGE